MASEQTSTPAVMAVMLELSEAAQQQYNYIVEKIERLEVIISDLQLTNSQLITDNIQIRNMMEQSNERNKLLPFPIKKEDDGDWTSYRYY